MDNWQRTIIEPAGKGLSMDTFNRIAQLLDEGESSVLAVIVSRSSSAPRSVGTRMVIRGDGTILGTIGGGLLEAQVRDLGLQVFEDRRPVLENFAFTAEEAAGMCMICGGEVGVLLQFVDGSLHHNYDLYQNILAALRDRKRAWLITETPSAEEANPPPPCLLLSDGASMGRLDPRIAKTLIANVGASKATLTTHQGKQFLVEALCSEGTVYIFGAGHISQELAPLTKHVGFQTIVLDDRQEFANRERFKTADEIIALNAFDRATDGLEINEDSYVVIVTRGHAHDKTLLAQALGTNAGYIGMIGSRSKRDAVYDALCKEGFSREEFKRVCSPIGLDIGAETPAEIAVSILAELIKARAKKNQ